jgi:hypothetical protein
MAIPHEIVNHSTSYLEWHGTSASHVDSPTALRFHYHDNSNAIRRKWGVHCLER